MSKTTDLSPGRLLREPGSPLKLDGFTGIEVHDPRLGEVLSPDEVPSVLYQFTLHGEGTVWDASRGRLVWSDVPNRRLLAWYPDGHVEVAIDNTQFMNGNAVDAEQRLVHCEHGRRCISRSNADGAPEPIVTHYQGKRLNSPNDVTVARDGTIWFTDPTFGILMPNQGSLVDPELDHRSVYRFDPRDGALRRMADFEQPNGLFFSPDGRTLYVSDTARSLGEIIGGHQRDTHEIQAFAVDADGSLSDRRLFCRTDHGYPDGFAVDERGWVWTTAGDGIHVYASDGVRLGFIPMPATPSNCCFGGPKRRRLFIAAQSYLLAVDLSD
ncbi:SMP-30/gluconolactonase/LRE family protein [Methylobacterium sp. GC_Met_2]|uniref:SMP-30/gluconolactonase/LRE family protein n=1 Tax=Methylobacterium sp. GC_Met_2 TaxID=2937376 RepID=UPI00226B1598|nr:SMP-30/gluconolactonase/LRE family protein [Methylobacterium sp. GC_Met_2]